MRSRASLPCTYKSDHVPLSSGSQAQSSPRRDPILDDDTILPSTPEKSQSGDVPSLIEPSSISRANDSSTSSLSHRLSVLEQLCQQPGHDTRQANSLKDLEARLSRIEQHIGNPKSSEPRPSDKAELRIKLPHPHLRAEHEKTRLFGKTHWVHSLEQVGTESTEYHHISSSMADHENSSTSFLKCNPSRTPSSTERKA